jgi:oligoendopeptidase F
MHHASTRRLSFSLALAGLAACQPPPPPVPAGFVPDANMERSALPPGSTWNLAPLFRNDAAARAMLETVAAERTALRGFAGKLGDPGQLATCLALYFDLRLETNKLSLYANLRFDSDQTRTELQALRDATLDALNALWADAAFIRQEVLAQSDAALAAAYRREPRLVVFRPYLDEQRRRRDHVLGAEAERVLALAGDNLWAEIDLNEIPSDFEKVFGAAMTDLPLPKIRAEKGALVQLTLANYSKYRASPDRRVRRAAVEALFGALRQHQHALAATFSGQVRFNVFLARARGYDSALAAYLAKDNIDPAVYHNLIDTVRANLAPLHAYVALRQKILGLDAVHLYDLYTPLVREVDLHYPFAEAKQILPRALAPLGDEYLSALATGLDERNGWLDLYPHKNKDSGAFSASVYGLHPFVKMNYFNDYDGLSTLAHEYGHAMHSHFSSAKQPYVTSSYATFIAEIASTTNEKLLSDYLLTQAKNDDERLFLLDNLLETLRTTVFRQTLFADFELRAHTAAERGTPLTAEALNRIYGELVREYYGPGFTLDADDEVEWAYVPHFYYKYYIFAYATGLSSGVALAERIRDGGAAAREAYLGMLGAGSSKPPLDILRDAGVDLTTPAAIEAATRLMGTTVSEIEAIWARRGGRKS